MVMPIYKTIVDAIHDAKRFNKTIECLLTPNQIKRRKANRFWFKISKDEFELIYFLYSIGITNREELHCEIIDTINRVNKERK